MGWRYLATRLNGDGSETSLDPELPLRDVVIKQNRNAPDEISASINPEYRDLLDAEDRPVLQKWSSAIYVEKDGNIRAGGILVDDSIDGAEMQIDAMGFAGYPNTQPYTEKNTWPANPPAVDIDPDSDASNPNTSATLPPTASTRTVVSKNGTVTEVAEWKFDRPQPVTPLAWPSPSAPLSGTGYPKEGMEPMYGIREIWRHLQAQPFGNLGVQIDPMVTGKKIGKVIAQGEYDTQNGPLMLEYEPFLLRWFETHDLGDVINNLCENLPLEFREEHHWNAAGDAITHFIRFGHPRLSTRRSDVAFVIGETVEPVGIDPPGDEYASLILGLGRGDGPAMFRGDAYRLGESRIRRAKVFEDKAASSRAAIAISARAELLAHIGVDEVSTVRVLPQHVGDMQHIMPGDEVRLYGEQEHRDVDMWVRIESKTIECETDGLEFDVQRVDRLA